MNKRITQKKNKKLLKAAYLCSLTFKDEEEGKEWFAKKINEILKTEKDFDNFKNLLNNFEKSQNKKIKALNSENKKLKNIFTQSPDKKEYCDIDYETSPFEEQKECKLKLSIERETLQDKEDIAEILNTKSCTITSKKVPEE